MCSKVPQDDAIIIILAYSQARWAMDDKIIFLENRNRLNFYIKSLLADLTDTRQADDAELQTLATLGHIEKHSGLFARILLL